MQPQGRPNVLQVRINLQLAFFILCFCMSFGLWACSQQATPATPQAKEKTEAHMPLLQRDAKSTSTWRPPIDDAVPERIETATFGLG